MAKILVVEDEPGIAFGLESDLQVEGYEVVVIDDGEQAVHRAQTEAFDLILLDVMLPTKNGFEVCRELRAAGLPTPIMMLTAKTHEFDKVMGLDLGADDYVTKPFSPRELRARIRAVLRHQPGRISEGSDLEGQLRVASEVQQRLFPQLRPPMTAFDYAGFCQPARGMSGDYFDFLDLSPGTIGLVVADVVGKGMPAALLMASVHAAVRGHAQLSGTRCGELLSKVNALLYEATDAAMFATVFYAVYEERSRMLTYANAGHEPPMLLRRAAPRPSLPHAAETNDSLTCAGLDSGTPPLGMFPVIPATQATVQLTPGDWLLIVTDGVTEARNQSGDEFGRRRLADVMTGNIHRSAAEMRDAVLSEVRTYRHGLPQADDVTLIAAHVR